MLAVAYEMNLDRCVVCMVPQKFDFTLATWPDDEYAISLLWGQCVLQPCKSGLKCMTNLTKK